MSLQPERMEIDSSVRRVAAPNGTALVGGSPFRVVRLTHAGARILDGLVAGTAPTTDAVSALQKRLVAAGMLHPVPQLRGSGTWPASVAVVIPVFDDPTGLTQVLSSVDRIAARPPVVVVDDGSADSASIARIAHDHGCQLRAHDRNRGPAAARNTGWQALVEQAQLPDVVFFLDADVSFQPAMFEAVLSHFADPTVAAVAPRVAAEPGVGALAAYESTESALDLGEDGGLVQPRTRLSYVPSAALAVRAEVLQQLGGFDEQMRFGEDVDLVWRIAAQHQVRYEPLAMVRHRNRTRLVAFARQRFSYGSSAADLAARHGRHVAPLQASAPLLTSVALTALAPGIGKLLGAAGSAALVHNLRKRLTGRVQEPLGEALRLTAAGHVHTASSAAAATTRAWLPLALISRRGRRLWVASLLLPAIVRWRQTRSQLDPVRYVALRALDHSSYACGVWSGVWRRRSPSALLPDVRMPTRTRRRDDDD